MTIGTLKSKNITKNVSLPAAWWDRLDAIVEGYNDRGKQLNRSDLIIGALAPHHHNFLSLEKELGLEPYTLEELT